MAFRVDDGRIVIWCGSRAAARAEARTRPGAVIVGPILIPASKSALIGWLNRNFGAR